MDAVFLDLDGTLIDTAPDLIAVLNRLLREDGHRLLPYALARSEVSNGALGLLRRGYGAGLDPNQLEALRARFLCAYAERVCVKSRLFVEVHELVNDSDDFYSKWGIVTNKPRSLTDDLLAALGISGSPDCIVAGDTLPQRKPHPAPLRYAAELVGIPPEHCVYVGDAPRDIVAAKAAGMRTLAAAYGYIPLYDDVRAWGADAIVYRPRDLRRALLRLRSDIQG